MNDATNTNICVTCGAVLQGYYCPDEGQWRIPLLHRDDKVQKTANNVYKLRAQPQLIRYYHSAAGFPTQRTWLKVIANGHYQSWVGRG